MELYQHQKEFLKDNPNKKLLAWETGVGKTLAACEWMKLRPYLPNAIVICPKNIKQKWINDKYLTIDSYTNSFYSVEYTHISLFCWCVLGCKKI
jgi:hypothetical protein